jgi:hypothetical protein
MSHRRPRQIVDSLESGFKVSWFTVGGISFASASATRKKSSTKNASFSSFFLNKRRIINLKEIKRI